MQERYLKSSALGQVTFRSRSIDDFQGGDHNTFPQHPANLCQEDATILVLCLQLLLYPSLNSRPDRSWNSDAQGRPPTLTAFRPLCCREAVRSYIYGHNQRHKKLDQQFLLVCGGGEACCIREREEREAEEEEAEE